MKGSLGKLFVLVTAREEMDVVVQRILEKLVFLPYQRIIVILVVLIYQHVLFSGMAATVVVDKEPSILTPLCCSAVVQYEYVRRSGSFRTGIQSDFITDTLVDRRLLFTILLLVT